jgi:hypothetical protein
MPASSDYQAGYRQASDYPLHLTKPYLNPENDYQRGWNAGRAQHEINTAEKVAYWLAYAAKFGGVVDPKDKAAAPAILNGMRMLADEGLAIQHGITAWRLTDAGIAAAAK